VPPLSSAGSEDHSGSCQRHSKELSSQPSCAPLWVVLWIDRQTQQQMPGLA
jgi:hypothetical protein